VLGEDNGKAVGVKSYLVERRMLATNLGTVLEYLSWARVVAETETTASLLRGGELVTGNHLDLDTEGSHETASLTVEVIALNLLVSGLELGLLHPGLMARADWSYPW